MELRLSCTNPSISPFQIGIVSCIWDTSSRMQHYDTRKGRHIYFELVDVECDANFRRRVPSCGMAWYQKPTVTGTDKYIWCWFDVRYHYIIFPFASELQRVHYRSVTSRCFAIKCHERHMDIGKLGHCWINQGWGYSTNFLPSKILLIFSIAKTDVGYWRSRLYLTGVTVGPLRWYLSNMNVIRRI